MQVEYYVEYMFMLLKTATVLSIAYDFINYWTKVVVFVVLLPISFNSWLNNSKEYDIIYLMKWRFQKNMVASNF